MRARLKHEATSSDHDTDFEEAISVLSPSLRCEETAALRRTHTWVSSQQNTLAHSVTFSRRVKIFGGTTVDGQN